MKKIISAFNAVALMLTMMFATTMSANAAKKCADFRSQAQAQAYYKKLKRANKTGWKSLDRNKDGVACECLKKKTCKGKKTTTSVFSGAKPKPAKPSKKPVKSSKPIKKPVKSSKPTKPSKTSKPAKKPYKK